MWRRALELDPLNPGIRASFGKALRKHGDADEAQREMKLALEMDPDGEWRVREELREYLSTLDVDR